ncbi:hypothetical protein HO291_003422 [Salmonella enterica]|nr:hypothetical protein [Salmonella enterica]
MKKLIIALAVLASSATAVHASDWNYYKCTDGGEIKISNMIGEYNSVSERIFLRLDRVVDKGETNFLADVSSNGQHIASMSVEGRVMVVQPDGNPVGYKCYFSGSDAGRRAYLEEKEKKQVQEKAAAEAKAKEDAAQAAKDNAAQEQIFSANARRADAFKKQIEAKPFKEGDISTVVFPQQMVFERNEVKKYTCDVLTFSAVADKKFRATSFRKGAAIINASLLKWSVKYKKDDAMSFTESNVNLRTGNLPLLGDANGTTVLKDSDKPNASFYELYNCERNYF